jgi:hypothetical protein
MISTKRSYERSVKKSVSMPEILFGKGLDRQRHYGYSTFSDYVQALIRRDSMPEVSEHHERRETINQRT